MRLWIAAALTAILSGAGAGAARADLVTNGGFETGDFTGWAVAANNTGVVGSVIGVYSPHSGTYFAFLGNTGCCSTLSQSIADTVGQSLQLTYYLASEGDSVAYFDATWNGALIPGSAVTDPNSGLAYVKYQFAVIATGSDTLLFDSRDDPGYLALDDVSLTPMAALPEPISVALLGTGLLGLGLARHRRWQ